MSSENWIVEERNKRNLSQYKFAKFMNIASATLSAWELEKVSQTKEEAQKIKKAFQLYDKELKAGNLPKKRKISGTVQAKKVPALTEEDWKKIDLSYEKSYLKDFSVVKAEEYSKGGPKAIALFAGCGGMSLGFKAAGFDVCGFVEIEESARKIYSANFPKSECLGTDICKITDEEIKTWQRKFGHISLLCGGPPCQGFSLAGKRDENDARNQLYRNYLNIAKILKPEVIVLENVRLLLSMKDTDGELISEKITKMFSDIGYESKFEVLQAEEYGVPQARQRVIFIGVRRDLRIKPTHPEATHSLEKKDGLKKALTFRDACRDLASLENGESCKKDPLHWAITHPDHVLKWLRATPEGKSAHDNKDINLRPPSGYNTTYKRISWDEPASTISTNFNMISGSRNVHPTNTRSYTIREAMRSQSFPDDFKVVGKWDNVRKAIGNAVPPLLAKKIAEHIMKSIFSQ